MSRKKKLDDIMEAVAFAEVGETEHARRLASEIFPERSPRERILAVAGGSGFSQGMIEKALGMAERLQYGLVALTVPASVASFFPRLPGRWHQGARPLSAEDFRARAAERGIPFVHAEGSADPEKAVAEARRRYRRIAFLLVEPDLAPKARFAGVNLPIFLVAGR